MTSLSDESDDEMICVDTRGQIVRLRSLLEEMIDRNDLGDVKNALEELRQLKVTKEIIETTNIGITVNKLRKLTEKSDKSLSEEARQLIVNWRKLIPIGKQESLKPVKEKEEIVQEEIESSSSEHEDTEMPSSSSSGTLVIHVERPTTAATKPTLKRKRKTKEPQKPPQEEIDWRETTRKMILRRIEGKEFGKNGTEDLSYPKDAKNSKELAKELEEEIFQLYETKDNRLDYNDCVRSKTFNISDPNNPELREKFLLGIISPQQLARMKPDEMANTELKEKRSQWWRDGIQDSQLAMHQSNETSLLKCSRCGKNKVSYDQLQTRSADEPMTTFANCNNCGHRWKF